MKPPIGKLMATALRRCRDAEICWEQRVDLDLADLRARREMKGWGLRVNSEGKLGWAWVDVSETPENLLEKAVADARTSSVDGLIFSHGLPFCTPPNAGDPVALEPYIEKLQRLVGRLQFYLPSIVKDRSSRIRGGLRWHCLSVVTRTGERTAQRVSYHLSADTPDSPWLVSQLSSAELPESPSEMLCELAWQFAHSSEHATIGTGERPIIFTPNATAALITDLVSQHLDGSRLVGDTSLTPFGTEWLSPDIHLFDDGTIPGAPGSIPFDAEGQVRQRVGLIQGGVVHQVLADRLVARALGCEAPGLAVRDFASQPRPGWSNLVLQAGRGSLSEFCKEIKEAIVVDRLLPCTAQRENGEFCRLAQTAFSIRQGRPGARLAPFMLKGKYHQLLGRDLLGIGSDAIWAGRVSTPSIAVKRAQISSSQGLEALADTASNWW